MSQYAASGAVQQLTPENDSGSDDFKTPYVELHDPLLAADPARDELDAPKHKLGVIIVHEEGHHNRRLRRSSSDAILNHRVRPAKSPKGTRTPAILGSSVKLTVKQGEPQVSQSGHVFADERPPAGQSISPSEGAAAHYRHHDSTMDSAALRQRLLAHMQPTEKPAIRPSYFSRARTGSTPFSMVSQVESQNSGRSEYAWFPTRGASEPPTPGPSRAQPRKSGAISPLKPCMKQTSKSAAPTPPNERKGVHYDLNEGQQLRRVKTVDFEDTGAKPLLAVPPSKTFRADAKLQAIARGDISNSGHRRNLGEGSQTENNSAPALFNLKSHPADTAVTRTDVHVVAIAPSWSVEEVPEEEAQHITTPTMQIVESNNGTYQVVWNDISTEHEEFRRQRRSSSASQVLKSATSSPTSGLERVNTKLTEWSWGSRTPIDRFRPQIIVFPDEDGRASGSHLAVEEEDDLMIIAPPNSQRTSANASRYTSRAASSQPSRSTSHDETDIYSSVEASALETPSKQEGLVVPDADASPRHPGSKIGAGRGTKKPPTDRRLSNIEESDMKFRGHRDSVTLARSRIINAGGVSPDLLNQRDSILTAKKRMHAKNHATAAVRDKPNASPTLSEALPEVDDIHEGPLSPERRQDAADALKKRSSTPILAQKSTDAHRHIRILE